MLALLSQAEASKNVESDKKQRPSASLRKEAPEDQIQLLRPLCDRHHCRRSHMWDWACCLLCNLLELTTRLEAY